MTSLREPRATIGGVNLVAGFRAELWAAVTRDEAPAGIVGFNAPVTGPAGFHAALVEAEIRRTDGEPTASSRLVGV